MAGLVTKIPLLLPLINYSPHVRQTESQHTLYIKHLEEDIVKDNVSTNESFNSSLPIEEIAI